MRHLSAFAGISDDQPTRPSGAGRIVTSLMRLQDPTHTKVILVTLPETIPVSEAATLQEERRAGIEPFGWVINKCLTASETHDPLLRLRFARERTQIARVQSGLAKRTFMIGWRNKPPIGVGELLCPETVGPLWRQAGPRS